VWKEGKWHVAQCLEVDIASQGDTEQSALDNLREALELYYEPPRRRARSRLRTLAVDIHEAAAVS
jgi:predicted RNase H-like HicB family nuclease